MHILVGSASSRISKITGDVAYSGFITLNKEDVQQFIKLLSELEKEMA